MNDLIRLKETVDALRGHTERAHPLTTEQAKGMLVLSESISALLTSFLFKQKIIYGGES